MLRSSGGSAILDGIVLSDGEESQASTNNDALYGAMSILCGGFAWTIGGTYELQFFATLTRVHKGIPPQAKTRYPTSISAQILSSLMVIYRLVVKHMLQFH